MSSSKATIEALHGAIAIGEQCASTIAPLIGRRIELLLSRDSAGQSPLHKAVLYQRTDSIRLILNLAPIALQTCDNVSQLPISFFFFFCLCFLFLFSYVHRNQSAQHNCTENLKLLKWLLTAAHLLNCTMCSLTLFASICVCGCLFVDHFSQKKRRRRKSLIRATYFLLSCKCWRVSLCLYCQFLLPQTHFLC